MQAKFTGHPFCEIQSHLVSSRRGQIFLLQTLEFDLDEGRFSEIHHPPSADSRPTHTEFSWKAAWLALPPTCKEPKPLRYKRPLCQSAKEREKASSPSQPSADRSHAQELQWDDGSHRGNMRSFQKIAIGIFSVSSKGSKRMPAPQKADSKSSIPLNIR